MTVIKKIFSSGMVWLWVTILFIALDRYTKYWAQDHLNYLEPLQIFSFFNLTLAYNTGAAFNILHSASGWQNIFLGSLAVIVSIIIFCWLYKLKARERWVSIALCLILAGAIGNVWDRLLYGYVIDFLNFHWHRFHFAIFNIADSAICVGAFMLFCYWLKHMKD